METLNNHTNHARRHQANIDPGQHQTGGVISATQQELIDTTDAIAGRNHQKSGAVIGQGVPRKRNRQILTNTLIKTRTKLPLSSARQTNWTPPKTTDTFGLSLNNQGTLTKKPEGKDEDSYQTLLMISGNEEFRQIERQTTWKLVILGVISIIIYGAETWIPTKVGMRETQTISMNIVKRNLKTQTTTTEKNKENSGRNSQLGH